MKKRTGLMCLCLSCLLCLCACASPAAVSPLTTPVQEKSLAYMRTQYQNAAYVVQGSCTGSHTDSNGSPCYDVVIDEVLAGQANAGDIVHCPNARMQPEESYLLYLRQGDDIDYAEDVAGYELVVDEPLRIIDSQVICDGKRIDLSVIKEDIQKLQAEICAPSSFYYYDLLFQLVASAEEIFIGRVVDVPALSDHVITTSEGGVSKKGNYDASIVTIEAYGSLKGAMRFGQEVQIVHCPAWKDDIIDAATLASVGYGRHQIPALEQDGIYLFFLNKGPDPKQDYYFPVNPVQGAVRIYGEQIETSWANRPIYGYYTLTDLVQGIHAGLLYQDVSLDPEQGSNPNLMVIE